MVALLYANDGSLGQELWTSDGNSLGTKCVKDIYVCGASSNRQISIFK
jgi:ELWxxDGT repeat protein